MKNLANSLRPRLTYANVISTLALFLVLAGGTALATGLRKNSVNSLSVKNNSLLSADLRNGKAVTGADVADGSLAGADVADGSLGGGEVANGSITGADVADGSLGGEDLGKATVALANIAANAVNSAAILDGSITGADIGADAVGGQLSSKGVDNVVDASLGPVPETQKVLGSESSAYMSSLIAEREIGPLTGSKDGEGHTKVTLECPTSERIVSGGPVNLNTGSEIMESGPLDDRTWIVKIDPNGVVDEFSVILVCSQAFGVSPK